MSSPKSLSMNTERFLYLWKDNLNSHGKQGNWEKFVATVRGDNQEGGIANTHSAFFSGASGKAALKKYEQDFTEFHTNKDIALPSDIKTAVMTYFYNEKCLDKCNAIRSKKAMKKARRPNGWTTRPCVGKGGGAKAKDWDKVAKGWSGLMD